MKSCSYYFDLAWIITLSTIFRTVKKIVGKKGDSILVIQLVAMGDMINASSFFRELSSNTKQDVIILCHDKFYNLYGKNNPYAKEFVLFTDKHRSFCGKFLLFYKIFSQYNFIATYDLTGSYLSKWISFSTKSKLVLGIDLRKSGFNFIYNNTNVLYSEQHIVKSYLDLLRYSGYEIHSMQLEFWSAVPCNTPYSEKYVSICIGAGWEMREWTDQGFADVINHVFRRYKLKCVLLGNKYDIQKAHRIMAKCEEQSVVNMAGKTDIFEAACFLENSNFVVANDSGLMHIAACYNKIIFALFGPGNQIMWAPFSMNAHIISSNICTPCGNISSCKDNICMKKLASGKVIQTIDTVMSNI